jgi:ADP-ribose pyrophosphatase YjhB (NUDIX family)
MLCFDRAQKRFQVRAVGLLFSNNRRKILVHRPPVDRFWSFPGGRVDFGERLEQTLVREFREELGVHIRVGALVRTIENFFELRGRRVHELGFYFLVSQVKGPKLEDQDMFYGKEGHDDLIFRWADEKFLRNNTVYPRELKATAFKLGRKNYLVSESKW